MKKPLPADEPNESEQAVIKKLCHSLMEYFHLTPEGIERGEAITRMLDKWRTKEEARFDSLSAHEKAALKFIAEELVHGREPTVRGVVKAAGFRSSRSGIRIIGRLTFAGFLKRDSDGELDLVNRKSR